MNKIDNIQSFMQELNQLTQKYEIRVDACGCCNSPWLVDNKTNEILVQNLDFDSEEYTYERTNEDENSNKD